MKGTIKITVYAIVATTALIFLTIDSVKAKESRAEGARLTEQEALSFMERWADAESTENFDNLVSLIHPDAVYRTSDKDYTGLAAIRKSMEGTFSGGSNQNYQMRDMKVTFIGIETAHVTYFWDWTGDSPLGPLKITGRGTKVIVQDDDGLKVRLIHLNQDTVHAGGLSMRSADDQQALLDQRVSLDDIAFDSISGRYSVWQTASVVATPS